MECEDRREGGPGRRDNDGDEYRTLLRWVFGIVAGVVSGAILTGVIAVLGKVDNMATTQAGIKKDVEWIKLGVSDMYRKSQADDKHAEIYRTDQDQYGRIKNLDERVSVLEARD